MVIGNAYTPLEKITETQSSQTCSAQRALRVVIGFNLMVSLDKVEGKKSLPGTIQSPSPSPSDKQSKSSKSGLTSSFETLLSSPRPQGNKDLKTVALAIDSDQEICRGHNTPSLIQHEVEETCPSEHLELNHLVDAQSKSSRLQSHREHLLTSHIQPPPRNFEGFVNAPLNVEKRVFSFLPAYPQSDEGQASAFPLAIMDFMDACFLCKRQLREDSDIFMYNGDKAFCSEECRYHQIVIDERAECQEKFSCVAIKTGKALQSRRNNYRTKVLSTSTAAAA